ncbi:MAG: hypothetical protein ACE5FU_08885 [Nitrospinota bacterium]
MKKRRIYIVKKGFQGKVILLFVVVGLIGTFLAGVLLYFNLAERFDTVLFSGHLQVRNAGEIVFPVIVTVTLNAVLVSLGVGVAAIIYLSRRMENIFAMFREKCQLLKDGDLTTRVPYLYNDLTDDLTTRLNSVIQSLERSCQKKYGSLEAILNLTELFEKKLEEKRPLLELNEIHKNICEKIEELEGEVGSSSVHS